MKRYVRTIINFILICSLLVGMFMGASGCSSDTAEDESDYLIYYMNKDETKLVNRGYDSTETDPAKLISEMLEELQDDSYGSPAIPSDVTMKGFDFNQGVVTVDFDDAYYNITNEQEVLSRAAIVLTLSQVQAVDYVALTVNDEPYKKRDGTYAGSMTASDFVSDLGGGDNNYATADFKLYFANESGTALKKYTLNDVNYGEKTKEQFVVEQLINGPEEEGHVATLSSDVELLSVVTANNICYVDFGGNFNTEYSNVSNELVIYSIVDSLSELTNIHKVQISINGDSAVKYHNDISLAEPFNRNLDLVESE